MTENPWRMPSSARLHRSVPQNDVTFELRHSMGQDGHLPALAAELVGQGPTSSSLGVRHRRWQRRSDEPTSHRDGRGFRSGTPGPGRSLAARGNISGMSDVALETQPKVMQVMRDAFPERQRMAVIWNSEIRAPG